MQIALNINIQDQKIANFIQNKSLDEVKTLFLNFLKKEVNTLPQKPKHKWAEFGNKMNGLISEETADELQEKNIFFQTAGLLSSQKIDPIEWQNQIRSEWDR